MHKTPHIKSKRPSEEKNISLAGEIGKGVGEIVRRKETLQV